jgi:hypothetical protein
MAGCAHIPKAFWLIDLGKGNRLMRASKAAFSAARDHAAERLRFNHPLLPSGLGLTFFSFALFLAAALTAQRNARLAQDPIVSAVIMKSWDESGKRGGHFASISYSRQLNGATVPCHVERLRIGPIGDFRGVGDRIEIAPRQDSCYEPDIPGAVVPQGPIVLVSAGCLALVFGIVLTVLGVRPASRRAG